MKTIEQAGRKADPGRACPVKLLQSLSLPEDQQQVLRCFTEANTALAKPDLLRVIHDRAGAFDPVLTRYALERLLYRLGCSRYRDRFILRGKLLVQSWTNVPHRATCELDLLGIGFRDAAALAEAFRWACGLPVADAAVAFDPDSLRIEPMQGERNTVGARLQFQARLADVVIPIGINVEFGDADAVAAEDVVYPTLLGHPAPHLRAYTRDAVVADNVQAILTGSPNNHMDRIFDLWVMASTLSFAGRSFAAAMAAAFCRSGRPDPTAWPAVLSPVFATDAEKQQQWQAFLHRSGAASPPPFPEVVELLADFLIVPVVALAAGMMFELQWPPGGPWR